MTDSVRLRYDGPIAVLTIDRPDKANALRAVDRAMLRSLCAELSWRSEIKALVLTGVGERVFCAGIDLDEIKQSMISPEAFRTFNAELTDTFNALAALPQLTIARIAGTAAGAGLAMALACDIRIAAEHATFFYPVVKRKVVPPAADVRRLTTLIGPARAKTLLISGLRIDVAIALNWGLIEASAPTAELDAAVDAHVDGLADASLAQIGALKALTAGADDAALDGAYKVLFGRGGAL